MQAIPYGYCQCGCGLKTTVSRYSDAAHGYVAGVPRKFYLGHCYKGELNHQWKGGRTTDGQGYIRVHVPAHPRSDRDGYVLEHIVVVEAIIGRAVVPPEEVHHINGVRTDNTPSNLLLCADKMAHATAHRKQRAMDACGNPEWRKCRICQQYDAPENLAIYQGGKTIHHRGCYNIYRGDRPNNKKRSKIQPPQ